MSSCIACRNGSIPSMHICIVCKKKVHLFMDCSLPVIGQEESASEKRLCLGCSLSKFVL